MRFSNVDQLLKVKDDNTFQSIMASITCLMALAEVNHTEEVSQLVDFVNEQRSATKQLVVTQQSRLNATLIQNKRLNFNLIVHQREDGGIIKMFSQISVVAFMTLKFCNRSCQKENNSFLSCVGPEVSRNLQRQLSSWIEESFGEEAASIIFWVKTIRSVKPNWWK